MSLALFAQLQTIEAALRKESEARAALEARVAALEAKRGQGKSPNSEPKAA